MIKLTLFRQLLQRKWYQMYLVSFPLEHNSNAERGILMHGKPRFFISSAHACTLEMILQRHLMVLTQHGKQQLPVIRQQVQAEEKRLHKKTVCLASRPTTPFTCSKCDRDCHSRIGLHSHNRRCKMGANLWSFETDRCQ